MKRFKDVVVKIFELLAIICFSIMLISTTVQVIGRYVFHNSPMWTEELARYMFVAAAMCGAVVAMDRGAHMEVDIITAKMTGYVKKTVKIFSQIVVLIVCAFIIYLGLQLASKTFSQPSPSLHMPIGLVYGAIPVGCIGMFIVVAERMIGTFKKTPEELIREEVSEIEEILQEVQDHGAEREV